MNSILARTATLGLGLVTAGLALGASSGAASAAPSRTPAVVITVSGVQPTLFASPSGGAHGPSANLANPVRPTRDDCKPNDTRWGCGAPADPDNITESTDCSMTQGQNPETGDAVFQEFCITSTTYWEGQDKD